MRIAIVHYHLKRGGVTRIIESTLLGFNQHQEKHDYVVLSGEYSSNFTYRECVRTVAGLNYSNQQQVTPDSKDLLQQLRSSARAALGASPDVWHIHNHSLGKNHALPGLVALLAKEGESVLLQMHDFAEDGRPDNYTVNKRRFQWSDKLYPNCQNVHYGVINARDYQIFSDTGIDNDRLHLLANPIDTNKKTADQDEVKSVTEDLNTDRLIVYPVRATRRKNFGELLLWATIEQKDAHYATTLGPTNSNYYNSYARWQKIAKANNLPISFGIGECNRWSFENIISSAEAIITTSIAEGFGLSFLEPWMMKKHIIGRNLPEITADFKIHGIKLENLYTHIPIPDEWIDMERLLGKITNELKKVYSAYDRDLPVDAPQLALDSIRPTTNTIDFGGLDEDLQEKVLEFLINEPKAKQLLPQLTTAKDPLTAENNRSQISNLFSLNHYIENLIQIYASIQKDTTIDYFNPNLLIDGFLKPKRFRLLRT
tara:strand:- start:1745 stop:3196 length:1452 start_codon:yes stop_codon:yes gene_type:complete